MTELLVEIFESQTHGRGLRAKRDIKPGELLMRDEPFTYVVYHGCGEHQTSICDHCLAEKGSKLLRCSGCKFNKYCDKTCQKAAWKEHQDICHSMQRGTLQNNGNMPMFQDQMRLLAQVVWKRKPMVDKLEGHDPSKAPLDADGFPTIPDDLAKHNEKWGPERKKDFQNGFIQLCRFMYVPYIRDVDKMRELFSILQANCVEISDGELHNIGYGLYLRFAFFNHACDFNCVTTFNGPTLDVRATKEIKKGEECFISYTELYAPSDDRQRSTGDLWYFTCKCNMCEDKDRDARISALKCGNNDCTTAVPFFYMKTDPSYKVTCPSCSWSDSCKKLLDKNWPTVKKMHKNKRLIDRCRKNPEMCEWSVIKVLAETNLAVGAPLFHHQNYLMMKNTDVAMDACIHLEMWDRALEYGLQSLGSYREFYPEYHPATGVQLMRLGKLHLYLEQLPEAQKMLQQAHHIIVVSHGEDHPLMKTLKELLFNCEEEMRVKRMESLSLAEDVD